MTGRSRKDDLAAQLAARQTSAQFVEPRRPEPDVRPTARTKPIRRTVDLSPARHRALNERQEELATQLGVADVPGQYMLEELVALYLTDETTTRKLNKRVSERIELREQERAQRKKGK